MARSRPLDVSSKRWLLEKKVGLLEPLQGAATLVVLARAGPTSGGRTSTTVPASAHTRTRAPSDSLVAWPPAGRGFPVPPASGRAPCAVLHDDIGIFLPGMRIGLVQLGRLVRECSLQRGPDAPQLVLYLYHRVLRSVQSILGGESLDLFAKTHEPSCAEIAGAALEAVGSCCNGRGILRASRGAHAGHGAGGVRQEQLRQLLHASRNGIELFESRHDIFVEAARVLPGRDVSRTFASLGGARS